MTNYMSYIDAARFIHDFCVEHEIHVTSIPKLRNIFNHLLDRAMMQKTDDVII